MKERIFQSRKISFNWKKLLKFRRSQAKRTIKKLGFLALLPVFLASIYVWQNYNATIYERMKELKLLPEPECFTELYFQDYKNLPQSFAPGQKISFSFAIRNLEGKDREYPYSVYFESDSLKLPLDNGNITVKSNDTQTINESYVFGQDYGKGRVMVELPDKNQRIHFQLTPLSQLIEIANINW